MGQMKSAPLYHRRPSSSRHYINSILRVYSHQKLSRRRILVLQGEIFAFLMLLLKACLQQQLCHPLQCLSSSSAALPLTHQGNGWDEEQEELMQRREGMVELNSGILYQIKTKSCYLKIPSCQIQISIGLDAESVGANLKIQIKPTRISIQNFFALPANDRSIIGNSCAACRQSSAVCMSVPRKCSLA